MELGAYYEELKIAGKAQIFDSLKPLTETIMRSSPFESIIKGHLYVERELVKLLQLHLKEPDEFLKKRVMFGTKLDLVVALGVINKQDKPAFEKLNKIRNDLAHNVDYLFSDKDFDDLWATFSHDQRDGHAEMLKIFGPSNEVDLSLVKFQFAIISLWLDLKIYSEVIFPYVKQMTQI